jgi:hypothetical protein
MNKKIHEINKVLETLRTAIDDYFCSLNQERVVIEKQSFHKIKHIYKLNSYIHLFEYDQIILFTLTDSGYPYKTMHYKKLMSGELDRIVLNKLDKPYTSDGYNINYELEPIEKTTLFDRYPIE